MSKQIVKTDKAPLPVAPYSQATIANGMIFTSGQLGIPAGQSELVSGGIQAETRQALENIRAVLEAAGSSLANVLKVTVFLDDINDFAAMNEIYSQFFTENHPARSAFQVGKLPRNAKVEIETVALLE
jgi:2-iminobutanoate/2-iminopropanoate deaminase